jgi:proline dehydrogenase
LASEKGIIRRLAFTFVKKHIAGFTTESALRTALNLNRKGYGATITFLNESAKDYTKSRYNINAYIHIMRQISRLRIKADISIRPTQIGYMSNHGIFSKGLAEITKFADQSGIQLWLEYEDNMEMENVYDLCLRESPKSLGFEIPALYADRSQFKSLAGGKFPIKLNFTTPKKEKISPEKKFHIRKGSVAKEYAAIANWFLTKKYNVRRVMSDEHLIGRLSSSFGDYKKNLIFEILLGYEGKKAPEGSRSKPGISVYMPYGKDWIPYAISRLTEGRMRGIAIKVLDGKKRESKKEREGEGE